MAFTLDDKRAFAEWLATPPFVIRSAGLPESKEAYSRLRGVASRTLRRWEREDAEFAGLLVEAEAKWRGVEAPGDVPEAELPRGPEAPADAISADYAEIRVALVANAKAGDPKALDLFMKHYGAVFAQEEQAARQRGLSEVSDDELIDGTLELIGRERVLLWIG